MYQIFSIDFTHISSSLQSNFINSLNLRLLGLLNYFLLSNYGGCLMISGPKGSNSSSYGQSPVTPASNCSFVPYSISSGSGAWSSWSASTPASSTSISAAAAQQPACQARQESNDAVSDADEKDDTFSIRQTVVAQQCFVPMSASLIWSASRPRTERVREEHSVLESGSSIPKKYHNQMTRYFYGL